MKKKVLLVCSGIMVLALFSFLIITKNDKKEVDEEIQVIEEERSTNITPTLKNVMATNAPITPSDMGIYEDTRGYTEEELLAMDEPEGSDVYEVDEEESPYTVYIENINEMSDKYNDMYNTSNLKYYIMVYLKLTTGNMDERYVATLVDGSCINSEYNTILTVDATIDKLQDVVLHIEYDKVNKAFGISSELGDYSLDALKKESDHMVLEYDPSIETEYDNSNITTVSDAD